MNHSHKRIECHCGAVILSCRCPEARNNITYETCKACIDKKVAASASPGAKIFSQYKTLYHLTLAQRDRLPIPTFHELMVSFVNALRILDSTYPELSVSQWAQAEGFLMYINIEVIVNA